MKSSSGAIRKAALKEGFVDLPGFEGLYMVKPGNDEDTIGSVLFLGRTAVCGNMGGMRHYPSKVLTHNIHPVTGHAFVNIRSHDKKSYHWQIGRLVLMVKLGRHLKRGLDTRHLNGNPLDNRPGNLIEGTRKQNVNDSKRHGTFKTPGAQDQLGSKNNQAKVTERRVKLIRCMYSTGRVSMKQLAAYYDVTVSAISSIVRRKNWQHVPDVNLSMKRRLYYVNKVLQ